MNSQYESRSRTRENTLAVMLTVMLGGGFLAFLMLITGGLLLQIGGAIVILAMVGWLHFQLWGKSLDQQTEGEREEAELRDQVEMPEWDLPGPRHPRND